MFLYTSPVHHRQVRQQSIIRTAERRRPDIVFEPVRDASVAGIWLASANVDRGGYREDGEQQ
jgi:hypothetical protein